MWSLHTVAYPRGGLYVGREVVPTMGAVGGAGTGGTSYGEGEKVGAEAGLPSFPPSP